MKSRAGSFFPTKCNLTQRRLTHQMRVKASFVVFSSKHKTLSEEEEEMSGWGSHDVEPDGPS